MIEFWEEQAKKYKGDVKAVNFDVLEEELEHHALQDISFHGKDVCDLGCGNGRLLLELAKTHETSTFHGFDFSEQMIRSAHERRDSEGLENVHFRQGDVLDRGFFEGLKVQFDIVVTKRLLINVKGQEKLSVIENIHKIVRDDGTYIMIECFLEPLMRINEIRKMLKLKEIEIHPFNEYLTEDFFRRIGQYFTIVEKRDFQSLYYFISRIYNAALTDGEPDYLAPINILTVDLIKKGYSVLSGFAPEVMYILEKNHA